MMSKMEIKFWNKDTWRYSILPNWYYYVNNNNEVFCEGEDGMEEQIHIEPHFFLDGTRVA